MKCPDCQTEMKCYDDIRTEIASYDWLKCEKCGTKAEVSYRVESICHVDKVKYFRE